MPSLLVDGAWVVITFDTFIGYVPKRDPMQSGFARCSSVLL
jgi:hypothetical protein